MIFIHKGWGDNLLEAYKSTKNTTISFFRLKLVNRYYLFTSFGLVLNCSNNSTINLLPVKPH